MPTLPIVSYPDRRLLARAVPVVDFDRSLDELIDGMVATLRHHNAVGLAACQVGSPLAVIVISSIDDDGSMIEIPMINPAVTQASPRSSNDVEGCLSLPGVQRVVRRACSVIVEYVDRTGEKRRMDCVGSLSRAVQHEIDHLRGITLVERTGRLARRAG